MMSLLNSVIDYGFLCLFYFICGLFVLAYIDDTETRPLGWEELLPWEPPQWTIPLLWPIALILSFVRRDD